MLDEQSDRAGQYGALQVAAFNDQVVQAVAVGDLGDILLNDRSLVQLFAYQRCP